MSNFSTNNYLFDEWNVIEKNFDINSMPLSLKIFETSNGYIKMTGDFEEETFLVDKEQPYGTCINGVYEINCHGFEKRCSLESKISNVAEARQIKLYVDDEEFNMISGVILEYERNFDLKNGVLCTHLIWESPRGRRIEVTVKRIVSFSNKHLAALCYEVVPLNFSGKIKLISSIKMEKNLKILNKKSTKSFGFVVQETSNTKFKVICGVENSVSCQGEYDFKSIEKDKEIEFIYDFEGKVNKKIQLDKFILYFTSKEFSEEEMAVKVESELINIKRQGFIGIEKSQKRFLEEFWRKSNIKTSSNKNLDRIVRFNEFKLLQKYGENYIAV